MLEQALCLLKEDLPLAVDAPGGMIEFRRTVSLSFFFKFFLSVSASILSESLAASEARILENHDHTEASTGKQVFATYPHKAPVGDPVVHLSAIKQATGEAIYASDVPQTAAELHACYVFSTKAHAKLINVDATAALKIPGVQGFFCAKDIPGRNIGGLAHLADEVLFADGVVHAVGQVIGVIVASDASTARLASRSVKIQYEDLPAILTIAESIRQKAFEFVPNFRLMDLVLILFPAVSHLVPSSLEM